MKQLEKKILRKLKVSYQFDNQGFVKIVDYSSAKHPGEAYDTKRGILCKVEKGCRPPTRANTGDAGADLYAALSGDQPIAILPGEQYLVDTGVSVKIPYGYAGFIHMRSSQRAKGITGWGTGIIDSDYRGNLKVIICNNGNDQYVIDKDTKIAQLVIQRVELVDFVDFWNDTERGTGGFGSTGK